MDILKKVFPFSFGTANVGALVLKVIIYVVVGAVLGFLLSLVGRLPLMGLVTGIVSILLEIYIVAGIVLTFLAYFKVLK